jgi:rod shape-determining protein MreC
MESFFARYRNLIVLLAVLMVQIIGLAVQVRRTSEGRNTADNQDAASVRLIRLWAESVVAPPEKAAHYTWMSVVGLWKNYIDLRNVRKENTQLQEQIDRLRLAQASLLEDARQGQRLQTLLDFQHRYIYKTLAAQAIGSSGNLQSHVFYLDKGANAGLKPDMAVITPDGIVGKVRDVFPTTAQVLMINDQTSGAGVILENTRVRGILTGNASGQLEIVGILSDDRIKPGERVLTAGGDLVYPRGLPVGVVDKVIRDPDRDAFIIVMVKPAAHLNRLDEVLVITDTQPRLSPQDEKDLATSEAIKGEEAQEIKDQLKASEIMAEHLPSLIDPNLPPDQQPLLDNSNPTYVAHPPQPLRPDRFSPIPDNPGEPGGETGQAPKAGSNGNGNEPVSRPPAKTRPAPGGAAIPAPSNPQRNQ